MILSPRQFGTLTLLHAEEKLPAQSINTLTLASLLRRGMVKATGRKPAKQISPTNLGTEVYNFNTDHKIAKWKEDLALAREMKG